MSQVDKPLPLGAHLLAGKTSKRRGEFTQYDPNKPAMRAPEAVGAQRRVLQPDLQSQGGLQPRPASLRSCLPGEFYSRV